MISGIRYKIRPSVTWSIDAIIHKTNTEDQEGRYLYPGLPEICYVFANNLPGSPVRRLILAFSVFHARKEWLAHPDYYPKVVTAEVAEALLDRLSYVLPDTSTCEYHQHGS